MRQVKTTLTASPSLPSIFDLARMGRQCAAEATRLDSMPAAVQGRDTRAERRTAIWARKDALDDLAASMLAETLRDAVALLVQAHMVAERLEDGDDQDRLRSILTNVVPVLASAAGVDLAEIEGEHIPSNRDAMFGPPPAMA